MTLRISATLSSGESIGCGKFLVDLLLDFIRDVRVRTEVRRDEISRIVDM